jgi:hypothetical protein
MPDYRTIITTTGQTKLAAAILGPALVIQKMAVGDAGGVGYDPAEAQIALVGQVYEANLDSVETLAGGIIVCELTIPADQGGWHVREAAIKDDAGDIIAIARIADRYKPLPASGQADELTIRMKLDVGNVGNVDWIVDLTRKAKIDGQLRPDFRSVEAIQNDPAGAPNAGETWIVGAAPTGAWVGHENELAEWSGTGWTFAAPSPWMLVGLADRTDWRWDHTLGAPVWVEWKATADYPGPIRLSESLRLNLTYPEVETSDNRIVVTDNANGTITVAAGQSWIWRGHQRFSTDDFLLADRTFATVANKVYHLRWHAPGTGTAIPEATYPKGRFELADMTAAAPAESDASHDTTYDRALLAHLQTNGANVVTISALANAAELDLATALSGVFIEADVNAARANYILAFLWSRTPTMRGLSKLRSFYNTHSDRDFEVGPGGAVMVDGFLNPAGSVSLTRYQFGAVILDDYVANHPGYTTPPIYHLAIGCQ